MKNIFNILVYSTLSIFLLGPCLISCRTAASHVKKPAIFHSSIPYESFVFIRVEKIVKPERCLEEKDLKKLEKCKQLIKTLPVLTFNGVGSGSLILHNDKVAILTAAHVCTLREINETTYQGHRIKLSTEEKLAVDLWGGKSYKVEKYVTDDATDLCLIDAPNAELPKPIVLSKNNPAVGDKVFNIAAPNGITGNYMKLIFEGRYSGIKSGLHYFTIPARPGSSGSAVLNEDFQLIGTVNIAFTNIEHVGIGMGLDTIRDFLNKNLK